MKIAYLFEGGFRKPLSGATKDIEVLISCLYDDHEITVFCTESYSEGIGLLNELDYRKLDLDGYRTTRRRQFNRAIESVERELQEFDIIHSYKMSSIPVLAEIEDDTTTSITSLQAYGGICPRNDLLYCGQEQCSGSHLLKCAYCAARSENDAESVAKKIQRRVKRSIEYGLDARLVKELKKSSGAVGGLHTYSGSMHDVYTDHGFTADNFHIIPNILDRRFLVEHRSDFDPPYKLLYTGRISAEKGVMMLAPLMHDLDSSSYEFQMTVAGDGPMLDDIKKQARELGVADDIDFLGYVDYDYMPNLYASHDLFVYPGHWDEPFGRIFIEALAAGTPVISTDVGDVARILGDSGEVVKDPQSLSSQLLEVVKDGRLPVLADSAKDTALQYDPDELIPEFERMYCEVV